MSPRYQTTVASASFSASIAKGETLWWRRRSYPDLGREGVGVPPRGVMGPSRGQAAAAHNGTPSGQQTRVACGTERVRARLLMGAPNLQAGGRPFEPGTAHYAQCQSHSRVGPTGTVDEDPSPKPGEQAGNKQLLIRPVGGPRASRPRPKQRAWFAGKARERAPISDPPSATAGATRRHPRPAPCPCPRRPHRR